MPTGKYAKEPTKTNGIEGRHVSRIRTHGTPEPRLLARTFVAWSQHHGATAREPTPKDDRHLEGHDEKLRNGRVYQWGTGVERDAS